MTRQVAGALLRILAVSLIFFAEYLAVGISRKSANVLWYSKGSAEAAGNSEPRLEEVVGNIAGFGRPDGHLPHTSIMPPRQFKEIILATLRLILK